MPKTIFITGATGLVGSYYCRKYLDEGYRVLALRRKTSKMHLLAGVEDQIEWYEGDVLNVNSLEKPVQKADLVIHSAAIVSFDPTQEAFMMKVNVEGTRIMTDLALKHGIEKFGFISSSAALGKPTGNQLIDENVDAKSAFKNTPYGISKFESEQIVWEASKKGLKTIIVNPVVVLGVGDWEQSSSRLIDYVWQKKTFYPGGIVNLIDVRDLADATFQLMKSDITNERFIVSALHTEYGDFFKMVANTFGIPAPSLKISPTAAGILWRIERVRTWLTGSTPFITKESATSTSARKIFPNKKLVKALNFNFRPIEETISWVCEGFLKDKKGENK